MSNYANVTNKLLSTHETLNFVDLFESRHAVNLNRFNLELHAPIKFIINATKATEGEKKVKPSTIVLIEKLKQEPYSSVLCYPKPTLNEIKNRIAQLNRLSIQALEFAGKSTAFDIPILGKGYVGIVVVGHSDGKKLALKMRRVDADRKSLQHEAELLTKANKAGVGPKFIAAENDFLLMQLIDADSLSDWIKTHSDIALLRKVLVDILEQCWRLDEAGLDHGELSKAPKHLLVDRSDKPFIVDFETASVNRKVANVTAICQYLFIGNSDVAETLADALGQRDTVKLIETLKAYKKERTRLNFEKLIAVCL